MSGSSTRNALVAGFGAILGIAVQGQAHALGVGQECGSQERDTGSFVRLRIDGERLLLSERGRPFEELDISALPQAADLTEMIRASMPASGVLELPVGPAIIASGGASGGWSEPPPPPRRIKKGKLPNAGAAPDRRRDLPQGS